MPAPAKKSQAVIPIAPAHAILGPSASDRWIACPGSIAAAKGVPQKPSNKYAEEGTAAHSLLEMCLRLGVEPSSLMGVEIEKGYPVTEDMAHAVEQALDFVDQEMKANPALRLHIEKRVKIGPLIGLNDGELEGTSDIILEDGRLCISVDYKHGAGVYVEVKDNSQLKLYALGQRHAHGKPYFKYRIVVIQPRMYAKNGRAVRDFYISERDLVDWLKNVVAPSAHAALTPNAPRRAGEHCRWCPANGGCREHARHAASMAAAEFGPIDPAEEEIEWPQ
jgi:hypothetical protein